MRTAASYYRQIDKLRHEHSEAFRDGRWMHMWSIRRRIVEAFDAIDRLKDRKKRH